MPSKIVISYFISPILDETMNHLSAFFVLSICSVLSFQFFLQLLCISLVSLIFRYSAQILLKNALFYRQNARVKNRLFCSKILPAEFIQAYSEGSSVAPLKRTPIQILALP